MRIDLDCFSIDRSKQSLKSPPSCDLTLIRCDGIMRITIRVARTDIVTDVSGHCGEMMSSGGETTMGFEQTTSGSPSPSFPTQPQRTKRMRTSFKHHQLRTMKSYFNINQNPDAKDLKQLAQKTGLSKRVLQVM